MVPVLVGETEPEPVVEIVPVRVVEIVPIRVVEIVPFFGKALDDKVNISTAVASTNFEIFIDILLVIPMSGVTSAKAPTRVADRIKLRSSNVFQGACHVRGPVLELTKSLRCYDLCVCC